MIQLGLKRGIFALGGLMFVATAGLLLPRDGSETAVPVIQRATTATAATEEQAVTPIPLSVAVDARKLALGRRLFNDPRLSHDNSVACASCHQLASGGADGAPHSTGIGGRQGARNAPTVYNAGFNARQFWDGRARSLEEQVDGPVQNPQEMGSTWDEVLAKLAQDAGYRQAFHELYGTAPTPDAVRDAIASFERALITPNAPFDRYLRGDARALSAEAAEGWRLFKALGCVSCHQGVNLGGNLYEKLGLVADYFGQRGHITGSDLGRYNLTHNAEHRFEFRVPPLRNVALTAPYLHDGSVQTLEEAVRIMGHHQLGLDLKPAEVRRLVAFLQSLTGQATEAAGLPASTAAAP